MVGMFSKPNKPSSQWSVGQPLNTNLPAAGGVQLDALPSIPSITIPTNTSSTVPMMSPQAGGGDPMQKLLQLLKTFQVA